MFPFFRLTIKSYMLLVKLMRPRLTSPGWLLSGTGALIKAYLFLTHWRLGSGKKKFYIRQKYPDPTGSANLLCLLLSQIIVTFFYIPLRSKAYGFINIICKVWQAYTVWSAAPQTTLWRGPRLRFDPGPGGLAAETPITRPPHCLENHHISFSLKLILLA